MQFHNPYHRRQYQRLCVPARTLAEVINQIFSQITESTSQTQFQQIQQSLLICYQELASQTSMFHHAGGSGPPHTCLRDIYTEAAFRLKNWAILQPPPPTPPEPADTQPPLTHKDVENLFRKLPPETFFGQERDEEDSQ
jgi:hypothetical protein